MKNFITALLAFDALIFAIVAGAIWKESGIDKQIALPIILSAMHILAIIHLEGEH